MSLQTRKQLEKKDYEALASFRYRLRKFLQFSNRSAIEVGLTPQQHKALLAVIGHPGRDQITVGELAERLQIQPHSAVGLVDRLVAQDLVVRLPADDDRRQVFIRLTSKGNEIIQYLSQVHRQELASLGQELRSILDQIESIQQGQTIDNH